MMFMLRGGTGERGGRGGALRLKLYLSMLWFGSGPPHDVTHPAYSWARLLGVNDPDRAGKRRVLDAIDWLDANGFVTRTHHPGKASTVRLLNDSGTGDPYTKPLAVTGGRPSYRQLDADWWRNGWLATLGGPSIVVWLAYLDSSGNKQGSPQWIAPSRTADRYGMSSDTRQSGLRELQQWGLLERRRTRRREPFVSDRPVTTYALEPTRLRTRPDDWI
jgi:hypothetical protein